MISPPMSNAEKARREALARADAARRKEIVSSVGKLHSLTDGAPDSAEPDWATVLQVVLKINRLVRVAADRARDGGQ